MLIAHFSDYIGPRGAVADIGHRVRILGHFSDVRGILQHHCGKMNNISVKKGHPGL